MVDERGGTPAEPEREGLTEGLEALREAEQAEIDPDPIWRSGIEDGSTNPVPLPDPSMDPDPFSREGIEEVGTIPGPLPEPAMDPDPILRGGMQDESDTPIPIPDPEMDPDPVDREGIEEVSTLPTPIPGPETLEGGEAEFKFFTPQPELEPEFTVDALDEGSLPIPTPEPLDDLAGEDLEPDLDV